MRNRRLGVLAALGFVALLPGCDASRAGTVASRSPLGCAVSMGESLADVRSWLGIAADGSQDATVRVVNLTAATGDSRYLLSPGKDLVCGSKFRDQVDLAKLTDPEQDFLRSGDVVLGGSGADTLEYVLGGYFRGGADGDAVGALSEGTFDGGPGNDQVNDGFAAGTYLGGDGDDLAMSMSSGTFDGGAGNDGAALFVGGTLVSVENCTLLDDTVCR